jgi:hypothetical protein
MSATLVACSQPAAALVGQKAELPHWPRSATVGFGSFGQIGIGTLAIRSLVTR